MFKTSLLAMGAVLITDASAQITAVPEPLFSLWGFTDSNAVEITEGFVSGFFGET